ncbi:hypothetical protein GWI33_009352, partial [Rhynchophorus ferrugineus]
AVFAQNQLKSHETDQYSGGPQKNQVQRTRRFDGALNRHDRGVIRLVDSTVVKDYETLLVGREWKGVDSPRDGSQSRSGSLAMPITISIESTGPGYDPRIRPVAIQPSDSAHIMTVQSPAALDPQDQDTDRSVRRDGASSKGSRISFSVASLLADTRPPRSPASQGSSTLPPGSPTAPPSSDDEYDSNAEDDDGSVVDVEDLNVDRKPEDLVNKDAEASRSREFPRETLLGHGPIRPTPFSALAAVYQAAHQSWPPQGLINPFGGPGPVFQGSTPFGMSGISSGMSSLQI